MAVIGFIPARGGSKSIPGKNIRDFCGKPLIYWVTRALSNCGEVDKVVVATDSPDIANTVAGFNLPKVEIYDRQPGNATDTATTESVMLEFLNAGTMKIENDDLFILAQATTPFTTSNHINQAIKQLRDTNTDSMLSCVRQHRFYWTVDGTPINYNYRERPRRQDFDGTMMENGAFYINRAGNIRRDKNRLSGRVGIFEMPHCSATEIDDPDDWLIAEALFSKHLPGNNPHAQFPAIKLFMSDVDGVLTDGGMYYTEQGDEMKKFNTRDGMAFQLLREHGVKTAIVTSEFTQIVERRAHKLKIDYLRQGLRHEGKLMAAEKICAELGINLQEAAYVGDDINCSELLAKVGVAACPADASELVKSIPGIIVLSKKGGEGAVREFAEKIIKIVRE